jgi:hypothetical protein
VERAKAQLGFTGEHDGVGHQAVSQAIGGGTPFAVGGMGTVGLGAD